MTNNILSGFDFIELCYDHGCRSLNAIADRYPDYFSISTLEKWHSRITEPRLLTQKALYFIANEEGWL
jgi:hypothetical protein